MDKVTFTGLKGLEIVDGQTGEKLVSKDGKLTTDRPHIITTMRRMGFSEYTAPVKQKRKRVSADS